MDWMHLLPTKNLVHSYFYLNLFPPFVTTDRWHKWQQQRNIPYVTSCANGAVFTYLKIGTTDMFLMSIYQIVWLLKEPKVLSNKCSKYNIDSFYCSVTHESQGSSVLCKKDSGINASCTPHTWLHLSNWVYVYCSPCNISAHLRFSYTETRMKGLINVRN